MTVIPGVTKPVNSWMNWKPCSKLPISGRAVISASPIATAADSRPTSTSFRSDGAVLATVAPRFPCRRGA